MRTKIKLCLFLLLFAFSLTFTLFSCSSNPTQPPIKPPPPPVVEPDSTTQNFTFQTYEFGDGYSSSYLNDVWIFNENNIWAVGDISPENGETFANILRWNGNKWYHYEREFVSTGFTGMWAADSDNIYLASNAIRKYEGGIVKTIDLTHLSFSQGQESTNSGAAASLTSGELARGVLLFTTMETTGLKLTLTSNGIFMELRVILKRGLHMLMPKTTMISELLCS